MMNKIEPTIFESTVFKLETAFPVMFPERKKTPASPIKAKNRIESFFASPDKFPRYFFINRKLVNYL